jgi:hypothetical protein
MLPASSWPGPRVRADRRTSRRPRSPPAQHLPNGRPGLQTAVVFVAADPMENTSTFSVPALTALGQLVTGHAIRTTANFGARLVRDCCAGRALPNCCMGARADTHEHHAGMTSTSTAQQRAPASFRAHFSARQGRNPADFSRVAELSRCGFSSVCGRTVTAMGWQRV